MLFGRTSAALTLLCILPLAATAGVLPERRTWEFMQSVGGISIGEPYREDATWMLPVSCDVSGLKEVTVAPTTLNSALAAAEVEVTIKKRTISLTVVTTMQSHNRSSLCRSVALGSLRAGRYAVLYRDPDGKAHDLGGIDIGK